MCSDNSKNERKPHSADYFVESRDFWWNLDFMQLMAKRLLLADITRVLDVGCGVGHWGRVLVEVLPQNVQILGIDLENEWIKEATKIAESKGLSGKCTYQVGNALDIPFPDNSFDMVTCQTLLIHLQKPSDALKEFIRVLKPNGVLLIAEPSSIPLHLWANLNIDTFIKLIRFQYICEIGKAALGEGWDSAGEFIAGFMAQLPVKDVQVFLSDKCNPLLPPYNQSKEQEIISKGILERGDQDVWIWDMNTTIRYYSAGMLKEHPALSQVEIDANFMQSWSLAKQIGSMFIEDIKQKKFSSAGGSVMYLTTARKI